MYSVHIPKVIKNANTPRSIKKAFHPITLGIHIIITGSQYESKGNAINKYATTPPTIID